MADRIKCHNCGVFNHEVRHACRACGHTLPAGEKYAKEAASAQQSGTATAKVTGQRKICSECGQRNLLKRRRCVGCRRVFIKPQPKKKPARGSMERVALELKDAQRKADEWESRVVSAVKHLRYWHKRERWLAEKLEAGPQPPKPKTERKPGRRMIVLSTQHHQQVHEKGGA